MPCSQPWLISETCIFCFYLFHEYDCVVSSLQPHAARSGLSMDMRTITLFAASWLSSKSWWNIFILVHSLSVKSSCKLQLVMLTYCFPFIDHGAAILCYTVRRFRSAVIASHFSSHIQWIDQEVAISLRLNGRVTLPWLFSKFLDDVMPLIFTIRLKYLHSYQKNFYENFLLN
jgi:hypothetical protein